MKKKTKKKRNGNPRSHQQETCIPMTTSPDFLRWFNGDWHLLFTTLSSCNNAKEAFKIARGHFSNRQISDQDYLCHAKYLFEPQIVVDASSDRMTIVGRNGDSSFWEFSAITTIVILGGKNFGRVLHTIRIETLTQDVESPVNMIEEIWIYTSPNCFCDYSVNFLHGASALAGFIKDVCKNTTSMDGTSIYELLCDWHKRKVPDAEGMLKMLQDAIYNAEELNKLDPQDIDAMTFVYRALKSSTEFFNSARLPLPYALQLFSRKTTALSESDMVKSYRKQVVSMEKELDTKKIELHAANEKSKRQTACIAQLQQTLLQKGSSPAPSEIPTKKTATDEKDLVAKKQVRIDALEKENKQQATTIGKQKKIIQHLQNKLSRPIKLDKIADWVSEQFADRLFLTDGAAKLLLKSKGRNINLDVLCDAIEYLAEDYLDCMRGESEWDALNEVCSYKYNRSFRVIPSSSTLSSLPDYNVKHNGKTIFMDLHLVWGNDPESLIRIYFYYEKEKKMIVVGSLPDHLPTLYQ